MNGDWKAPADAETKIVEILTHFDFERVRKVMKLLEWSWANLDSDDGRMAQRVPTCQEVREEAVKLLRQAAEGGGRVRTGGLIAACEADGRMWLAFALEEYDTGD